MDEQPNEIKVSCGEKIQHKEDTELDLPAIWRHREGLFLPALLFISREGTGPEFTRSFLAPMFYGSALENCDCRILRTGPGFLATSFRLLTECGLNMYDVGAPG